ncbi:hypothetical protein AGMMS49587_18510 [Spirochaetia bacterium]|nr:hypothetical protein AGMMS49587_18510 [Spirochaetia bacterium]
MRITNTKLALSIFIGLFLVPFVFAEEPGALPGADGLLDTLLESAVPAEEEADDEDFDEDLILNMDGPEVTVYYNERNEADYVEVRTAEKIEEYHYLNHIKYSDLIFVLSDLLRRITREGYQWSTAPAISYEKSEEVVLLYRRDLVNDMVYGIVQFPDFKVWLSGIRERDAEHRFNAGNGRDMMSLVFSFASCLAQAEQALGINQLEYTMKFFKQD